MMRTGKKMWKAYTPVWLFVLIVTTTTVGQGDKWYVALGGDDTAGTNWSTAFKTITNATARAQAFDEIIISNGIYAITAPIWIDNGMTCRGVSGNPEDVIVDCGNLTRGFLVTNAVLSSLTVTNAYTTGDGGAVIVYAGGTVSNCVLTGSAARRGAGARIANGLVSDCLIIGNKAVGVVAWGGGVEMIGAESLLIRSVIRNNQSDKGGGGVYLDGMLIDCTIAENVCETSGGGVLCTKAGAQGYNCIIVSNIVNGTGGATDSGGGLYSSEGSTWSNCVFAHNIATNPSSIYGGGGAFFSLTGGKISFFNCLFYGNQATKGGGYGQIYGSAEFHNCTFSRNSAGSEGGAYRCHNHVDRNTNWLFNCILYDNQVSSGTYSNYYFGPDVPVYATNNCAMPVLAGGADGNIAFDPEFINPDEGNFKLQESSRCVNAGINLPWMAEAKDLDGKSRIDPFSGKVDIGCYEHISHGFIFRVR